MNRFLCVATCALLTTLLVPAAAVAQVDEQLCDPSFENCRDRLLQLIDDEEVGIDVAFWFMEDDRYATALVNKWNEGVPVRVIMDTEANGSYPGNVPVLAKLKTAGIPMLEKTSKGIVHWKMMLFAGQNFVEFSGANFSPHAFVATKPYVDYLDEVIYFSNDPAIVNSFKTKYDDHWTAATGFTAYANIIEPRARKYDVYPIDPQMNFPPGGSGTDFANKSVGRYNAETQKIDSIMFRITDKRHTDALINAMRRGVPFRLITDQDEYRDALRPWHAYNVDLLHMATQQICPDRCQVKIEAHLGSLHQKSTLLYGQGLAIFGSSNWTSPSANQQLEHNIFTKKPWFFEYFRAQFERKWNNETGNTETKPFVPLPPGEPVYHLPANGAQNQATTLQLKWHPGPWGQKYDIYFGTNPAEMTLLAADLELGPSETATQYKTYPLSGLAMSTIYYWQIVSKTMANMERRGPVWSFRTSGTPPQAGPLDAVLWASRAPLKVGNWSVVTDSTAAGGARLSNPNLGAATVASSSLVAPQHYFEMTFIAEQGVPYRVWVRGKAASNAWQNDSVWVQFNDSVNASGAPLYQMGTASAANVTIEDCASCGLSGWGWNDNATGAGVLGPQIFFATSGEHTIRVHAREDGLSIDQIVLSRDLFLNASPGAPKNDGTLLTEARGGVSGETPPPDEEEPPAPEIVLHMTNAVLAGAWQLVDIEGAASGKATVLPNAARAKATVKAAPTDYFELTFQARANTPYRLWVRGRADGNAAGNDSVHVQFTDSIDAAGPRGQIGSTTSYEVNLEDCSGCGNSGWGWEDNGWGTPTTFGPEIRFATDGLKTIRVQNREDGFFIDQIVLSPVTYLHTAPGLNKDDTTILPPTP
jgi:phosphatidylserine/phosphatidylglycerophosphate/cardiolipin synthase-like enzyme